jgi:arylsulfatase A-like enzyme
MSFIFKTILVLISLIVCGISHGQKRQVPVSEKPNIIFIMVDDLGYGDIGVFYQNLRKHEKDAGLPFHLTPELDKMAAQGVIFTDQYSNAPVCAPSRASFLTGMTQGNAHIRNNQFDKALEDNHTVGTVLQYAGYKTAAIGKWGLQGVDEEGPNWPAHPLKRGFDYFYGYMRHADGHEHYPYEGIYRGKKEVWENYHEVSAGLEKCYTTDLWTAAAKQWITAHQNSTSGEQPFMMFLAYDTPHAVLELPTQAYPTGTGLHGGIQWIGEKGKMINTASGVPDSYVHDEYQNATYDDDGNSLTPEKPWPDTYVRYATSVRRIDDAIGDILSLLHDLDIDENTLVVFTSDNGPSIESYLPRDYAPNLPTFFGSYGPFDGIKRDVWEGGLRMPVIARWPSQLAAGVVISQPSMLSDWLATFADIAYAPIPARTDGASLLPALKNPKASFSKPLYVEYQEGGRTPSFSAFEPAHRNRKRGEMQMIRQGQMVGVRYDIKSALDSFEIYDIIHDPKQKYNLAHDHAMSSMQQNFQDMALQLRRTDKEAKRPYDTALVPAIREVPASLKKGLGHKYFKGEFPYPIDPMSYRKTRKSIAKTVDHHIKRGAHIYSGYIKVPENGSYTFSLESSNQVIIYLHGALAFDTGFEKGETKRYSYECNLEAGLHPIRIALVADSDTGQALKLGWGKDDDEIESCAPYFYHSLL